MNKSKFILITGLLMLIQMTSFGQYILPEFQSQSVTKNELLIRWEPRSLDEWQSSLQEGYQVKVYMGTNKNNLMLKHTNTIKPGTADEWDLAASTEADTLLKEFYEGAKNFLYMDPALESEIKESLMEEEGKSIQQTVDELKLGYLVYSITYDMKMIEMAGLGYTVALEDGYMYKIEVTTKNHSPFEFEYDPTQKISMDFPDLDAEFGDKEVTLKWSTPAFKKHYFGYYLSISENGKSFNKVSEMPFVNIMDTISDNPDAKYLVEKVELAKNYKDYWLRLRGMNYFGIQSTFSSTEKGHGFELIDVMPTINYSTQTEDNHAEIKWTVDRTHNRLIDHFAVYRANELEGEYKVVYDSISANDRMVRIPMEHNRNFYSIAIVPKDGPVSRSFSVFLMGQDTVPPNVPQNLKGVIDSMGIVTFTWDRNVEEDLWGYKLFRSEYITDEFGPLHPSPINDTVYVDSVNLNSINEEIHYCIIALDKRNNRSAFSSIISLARPDTIAPTPPLIKTVDFLEDSISVKWAASSSNDAIVHQIFRREINENGWKMISEQKAVDKMNYYMDTNFELNKIYAYTVTAMDDVDLHSAPSRAVKVQTISKRPKEAFLGFDVDFDREKVSSSIRWNLKNENDLEEIIVYRGPSKEEISMYKIVEPNANEITQTFEDSQKWFFLFKPIYNDGSLAKMSEVIVVEKPQ